nr:lytic transglycosylase domain-containing protein [Sphingobium yanoikuyae]
MTIRSTIMRRRLALRLLACLLGCAIATPSRAQENGLFIAEAAQRFALPEDLIRSVMAAESAGDPGATSHAGAMGLMQIMPATWSDLSRRHDLGMSSYEPRANILAGAAYLREMIDRYGDLRLALAAYNAGPGRVDAYRKGARALPAETLAYVARITAKREADARDRVIAVPVDWRASGLFIGRIVDPELREDATAAGPALAAHSPGERAVMDSLPTIFVRHASGPAQ